MFPAQTASGRGRCPTRAVQHGLCLGRRCDNVSTDGVPCQQTLRPSGRRQHRLARLDDQDSGLGGLDALDGVLRASPKREESSRGFVDMLHGARGRLGACGGHGVHHAVAPGEDDSLQAPARGAVPNRNHLRGPCLARRLQNQAQGSADGAVVAAGRRQSGASNRPRNRARAPRPLGCARISSSARA